MRSKMPSPRPRQTVRNMRWFEVTDMRGHIEENKINHWQVTVKIGFTLDVSTSAASGSPVSACGTPSVQRACLDYSSPFAIW